MRELTDQGVTMGPEETGRVMLVTQSAATSEKQY